MLVRRALAPNQTTEVTQDSSSQTNLLVRSSEIYRRIRYEVVRATIGLLAFSAAINLLALAAPIYMLQVYDRVIPTKHLETLIALSAMLAISLAVYSSLDALRGVILSRLTQWIESQLIPVVLDRTSRLSAATGQAADAQALRDLAAIRMAASGPGAVALFDLPWLPIFYTALFLLHPLIGLCVLIGGIVSFAITISNELVTRRRAKRASMAQVGAGQFSDKIVQNSEVVEAMGMLPALIHKRAVIEADGEDAQRQASDLNAIFAASSRFLRYGIQSGILGLAAYLVVQDALSPGSIIAASIISTRALAPLDQIVGTWKGVNVARFAWGRLRSLFAAFPARPETLSMPPIQGRVFVDRLVWGVREGGGPPVLRNVSFATEPGEVIGIIGPSGGGKTTLVKLIVGSLIPHSGVVRLDSADVGQLRASDRAKFIGYLPQDVKLFPGTVQENISRFAPCTSEEIFAAANAAGAHEMILTLPRGYDTIIGDGGQMLSGGQRQRIGLSRALFGSPVLVVLDEPNSNLDFLGEKALNLTVQNLKKKGATVMIVTQRSAGLTVADKVLVIREGTVQLYGPRDEVMSMLRNTSAPT